MLGFKGPPDNDGAVEIGYGIAPAYEGKGYTTEVVCALVGWAFSQPGCLAVTANTQQDNPASQRVLEKNGFHLSGLDNEMLYWRLDQA